jgi:hypothetical protein
VGLRCRECLIAFARAVATPAMVPVGQERPKAADFIHWSELVADTVSPGSDASGIRGHLKALARSTWQLVSWLTHKTNAVRYGGTLAVDAKNAVLNAFGAAILRHERPTSDRCSRCGSLRVQVVYQPSLVQVKASRARVVVGLRIRTLLTPTRSQADAFSQLADNEQVVLAGLKVGTAGAIVESMMPPDVHTNNQLA